MKIVLENEMELTLWETLLAAHEKWERNHGHTIRDQMEWYFFDLYKEETEKAIEKAVKSILEEKYNDFIGKTEEQYIAEEINDLDDEYTKAEIENLRKDLADIYIDYKESYKEDKEDLEYKLQDKVRNFYYNFFNAPESLIVEYNGNVIQKNK